MTGDHVVRQRRCRTGDHRFETVERQRTQGLSEIGVRRSGDDELAEGAFDWERFVRDVQNGVLKFLDEPEVLRACTSSLRSLETSLPVLQRALRPEEISLRPDLKGWIHDTDISVIVERALRQRKTRLAHVMYAMSIRGRADREGRPGWTSAEDVLEWLYAEENYPDLRLPTPARPDVPEDDWFPTNAAPLPRTVIKRDGRRPTFLLPQFESSIRKAMVGRPAADVSEVVAQYVLWGLVGQPEVHASQLAIGVLDCLRRVDDVAYLRWAAVAKNMTQVTQFRDEARGLIANPSSRLHLEVSARPRRPEVRRGSVPG